MKFKMTNVKAGTPPPGGVAYYVVSVEAAKAYIRSWEKDSTNWLALASDRTGTLPYQFDIFAITEDKEPQENAYGELAP